MIRWIARTALIVVMIASSGCKKEETASTDNTTPAAREIGQFSDKPTTTQPSAMMPATGPSNIPNDAIHASVRPEDGMTPHFETPPDWQPKPPRNMTDEVYALPKADGDPEDGDIAFSHLTQHIPMQSNMTRWCDFFGYTSKDCPAHSKQQDLQGTKFPTHVVDISGTYKGSAMSPVVPPKEINRMLVAEVRTPQQPFYVRLVGPQNTVAKWEEVFMKMLREAK